MTDIEEKKEFNWNLLVTAIALVVLIAFMAYCVKNIEFIKAKPLDYCGKVMNADCYCVRKIPASEHQIINFSELMEGGKNG